MGEAGLTLDYQVPWRKGTLAFNPGAGTIPKLNKVLDEVLLALCSYSHLM